MVRSGSDSDCSLTGKDPLIVPETDDPSPGDLRSKIPGLEMPFINIGGRLVRCEGVNMGESIHALSGLVGLDDSIPASLNTRSKIDDVRR